MPLKARARQRAHQLSISPLREGLHRSRTLRSGSELRSGCGSQGAAAAGRCAPQAGNQRSSPGAALLLCPLSVLHLRGLNVGLCRCRSLRWFPADSRRLRGSVGDFLLRFPGGEDVSRDPGGASAAGGEDEDYPAVGLYFQDQESGRETGKPEFL